MVYIGREFGIDVLKPEMSALDSPVGRHRALIPANEIKTLKNFAIFFDRGLYSLRTRPYSAHHNDGHPTL
ncbi:hypothetical protein APT63_17775 [Pseudomonas sp. 22-AL-CL-001]|nr:hypothetical protein APT63_17775 [Pseudomonas monteilii]